MQLRMHFHAFKWNGQEIIEEMSLNAMKKLQEATTSCTLSSCYTVSIKASIVCVVSVGTHSLSATRSAFIVIILLSTLSLLFVSKMSLCIWGKIVYLSLYVCLKFCLGLASQTKILEVCVSYRPTSLMRDLQVQLQWPQMKVWLGETRVMMFLPAPFIFSGSVNLYELGEIMLDGASPVPAVHN